MPNGIRSPVSARKSTDLRRIVQTALERNIKKYDLQAKQLKDTEKRENTGSMGN